SLVFLANQIDILRPVIESLISHRPFPTLSKFYNQVLTAVADVRRLVYGCVASRALNYPRIIALVSSTKWDIADLQSQHSQYVDVILEEIDCFAKHLEELSRCTGLQRAVTETIWDVVIHSVFKALVQGYCESSKRCSSEGRALMQLDLTQLVAKIEEKVGLKPVPHTAFVENYIKAYYLPESSLEQWIQQHGEYTANQIITLLNVATHVSRKARARIISALDE
ncbi:hypothetical protein AB6A40_010283, partial [Gnathostoma spinigerum]